MEIQTRVAPAEIWLRDDLENIYSLLFRFLGFGFRLAMSTVGWHVTQKFVILVPDPIAFAPRPALLDPGEPCDICQYTSFRPPIAGLSVAPWNKDDMGDGVPTDQLSHNHCDCTDSHCNSHIVTSCVFVLVLHSHHKSIGGRSSSATSSRRRSTGRSRRVAAASRRSGRSARRAGPNAAGVLVNLSKHTFYTRFHFSLCQRNYEQVRLVHLTVIAFPVPQILEQSVEVIKVIPEEWMSKRIVQQIVDVYPFSYITPSALLLSLCSSVG